MKLVFCGNFQQASGSSQVVYQYYLAGAKLGIDVLISDLGPVEPVVTQHIPTCQGTGGADVLVLVFESTMYITDIKLSEIERKVPRQRRVVIDADGKYNNPISFGRDSNHRDQKDAERWRHTYDALSDVVVQPKLSDRFSETAEQFLYFGYEGKTQTDSTKPWQFDILYVGNNWYRWQDVVWLVGSLQAMRDRVPRIALIGQGWQGTPLFGNEEASFAQPEFLRSHAVQVHSPVPFGKVVTAMSRGRINPIFVRPILRHMHFATPRMFETFCANTVPILAPYLEYTSTLYGTDAVGLLTAKDPAEKIVEVFQKYAYYQELVSSIQEHLFCQHSYIRRLQELISLVD